ncbi:rod shape-determining protein [Streptomyces sp. NPDC016675]|uniref:rod shape-determining protein n=1 Tax=Streptomyces sp. NPDC016675 TaxID=3364970 RepID=UPI0036F6AB03
MTVVRLPADSRRLPWPLSRHRCGVALDIGSARTRAWVAGRGLVLDVPTVTFAGAGAVYPVQRGRIVDTEGAARMLGRLLAHRLPRFARPLVVVTAPVLDGYAYRTQARTAVQVLRPRGVLTVPSARAVALAAGADLSRPLLVVDIGARLTEVVLLADGAVFDARRAALGTGDLDDATGPVAIGEAVAGMATSMLRQDRTSLTVEALGRGPLLAGGGALRPEITCRLADVLHTPLSAVPAPHTAAVRGAAKLLATADSHPPVTGTDPPAGHPC